MRKIITALITVAFCTLSAYAIEGNYKVSGYDPYWEKANYTGTVEICKDKADVYQAKWVVEDNVVLGTGLKTGDYLSFVFKSEESSKRQLNGVIVYKIGTDNLEGSFVYLGKSLVGNEKLEKK